MSLPASALLAVDKVGLLELSTQAFVAAYGKKPASDVKDALEVAARAKLVAASEGLRHQATQAVALLQAAAAAQDGEGEAPGGDADAALALACEALRVCAVLAHEVFAATKEEAPPALAQAAQLLHDNGLLMLGMCPPVQEAVSRLCCAWWAANGPDKEELLSQTLPYLLIRAVTDTKGRACNIKPCLDMRNALGLLDFEDESIDDMKRLMLQATKSPLFLRRPEGRRFLAHVATLHPTMVAEMASVMRNMVVTGKQWLLEAVGEVILRAWREASGPCAAAIEATLIQGFARALLHASSKALAANVLAVLRQLHEAKKHSPGSSLDGALVRLYEPLLFRALSAANGAVRRNAVMLLLDAFPLLDPEASDQEQDVSLSRQLAAVADALSDPAPAVRAEAAPGCCRLLDLYWEIIPSATTAAFVAKLTDQLAFDASAPGVRVATLEGLSALVDNVHAQPVMKRALPVLAPLMHDPAPPVREALADLLLCVSTSRGLKFWEVVPLEALLEVLARPPAPEDEGVAARLHHLLVPSYLPNPQEGAARVAALLKGHPDAGAAFCRQLTAPLLGGGGVAGAPRRGGARVPVPLERVLRLAAALATHLTGHAPAADDAAARSPPRKAGRGAAREAKAPARGKRKKAAAGGGSEAEGEGEGERDVLVAGAGDEPPEAWGALLGGLAELCCGIGAAVKSEVCSEADVEGLFPQGALQQLLDTCPDAPARRHVWRLAEHLPCLSAAGALRAATLARLAAGELLTGAPDVGVAAPAGRVKKGTAAAAVGVAADGPWPAAQRDELRCALACIAAAPNGAKLTALLAAALGLPWGPEGAGGEGPVATFSTDAAAGGGSGARIGGAASDEIPCAACCKAQPDHNLLLCDGCDAAFHTTCLRPRLAAVPDGDWFCPGCTLDIRGSRLSANAALECIDVLLQAEAGRRLLQDSGLLASALSPLQAACGAATEEALAALAAAAAPNAGAAAGGKRGAAAAGGGDAALAACVSAVEAAAFSARIAAHVLGVGTLATLVDAAQPAGEAGGEEDAAARSATAAAARAAGAAALSSAAVDAGSVLANTADWLAARDGAGEAAPGGGGRKLWGAPRRLAAAAAQLVGLFGDALRLGLAGPAAAGAAEAASCGEQMAGAGRAALALLLALAPCALEGPAEDVLKGDTALMRLLLAPPAPVDADGAEAAPAAPAGDQLHAWLEEWVRALAGGPLTDAAGAVRPHVPALLGVLVAGSSGAPGAAAGAAEHAWLLPLADAVAGAVAEGGGGKPQQRKGRRGGGSGDGGGADAGEEDGENVDPAAASGAGGKGAHPVVAVDTERLPAVVGHFVQAAKLKRVERELAARCTAAALDSGRSGEWRAALGALQLARMLGGGGAGRGGNGAGGGGSGAGTLGELRAAAAGAKGRAAALLVGTLDCMAV